MGEGLPISILKARLSNWLNRKEIVEKEISKFVSEGKTESRVMEEVGLSEFPGVFSCGTSTGLS